MLTGQFPLQALARPHGALPHRGLGDLKSDPILPLATSQLVGLADGNPTTLPADFPADGQIGVEPVTLDIDPRAPLLLHLARLARPNGAQSPSEDRPRRRVVGDALHEAPKLRRQGSLWALIRSRAFLAHLGDKCDQRLDVPLDEGPALNAVPVAEADDLALDIGFVALSGAFAVQHGLFLL
jgi:hypothetical protein